MDVLERLKMFQKEGQRSYVTLPDLIEKKDIVMTLLSLMKNSP